jgi:hypothetical protein
MQGITDLQYKELRTSVRNLQFSFPRQSTNGNVSVAGHPNHARVDTSLSEAEDAERKHAEKGKIIHDLFKVDRKNFDQLNEERAHQHFDEKYGEHNVETQSEKAKAYRLVSVL